MLLGRRPLTRLMEYKPTRGLMCFLRARITNIFCLLRTKMQLNGTAS